MIIVCIVKSGCKLLCSYCTCSPSHSCTVVYRHSTQISGNIQQTSNNNRLNSQKAGDRKAVNKGCSFLGKSESGLFNPKTAFLRFSFFYDPETDHESEWIPQIKILIPIFWVHDPSVFRLWERNCT